MNRVNLLPESSGTGDVPVMRSRPWWRCIVALAAILWIGGAWAHVRSLDARIAVLRKATTSEYERADDAGDEALVRARAAWAEPIPAAALLTTLASLTPPEMEFSSLVLDYPRPGARAKVNAIGVQLDGVALDGSSVIRFTEMLLSDKRFRNVRMSGDDAKAPGTTGRRAFRIAIEAPLEPAPWAIAQAQEGE